MKRLCRQLKRDERRRAPWREVAPRGPACCVVCVFRRRPQPGSLGFSRFSLVAACAAHSIVPRSWRNAESSRVRFAAVTFGKPSVCVDSEAADERRDGRINVLCPSTDAAFWGSRRRPFRGWRRADFLGEGRSAGHGTPVCAGGSKPFALTAPASSAAMYGHPVARKQFAAIDEGRSGHARNRKP